MRLSTDFFTKTKKNAPADETAKNAQLLIRAGYVHKEMAGVYSLLPLGYRVVEKIVEIVESEMDGIGGVRMKTSALQSKKVWEKTNRWDDEVVDNWFKTSLKNGTELGLSFTNEEAYASIMKNFIHSYKDLPAYPYDFKTIFRNELRSKSGVMRGREFYWKALYSFSKDQAEHEVFYEQAKQAYQRIFERAGLGEYTYFTFASGGTFSKYSHEFQTVAEAGEDTIYIDTEKNLAINDEVLHDDVLQELGIDRANLTQQRAIEVGNIFSLGHKFSEPLGLTYTNEDGKQVPVFMGSYGIGITRLMGVIVEKFADEKGLVWPENIAPARVYLVQIGDEEAVVREAEDLYNRLTQAGVSVMYDDRDMRAGEKFADAELIGIPWRVVVSSKTIAAGNHEIVSRDGKVNELLTNDQIIKKLAQ